MYMLPSKSNIMVKSLGLFKMLRYLGFLGEKVDTQKGNYLEKNNNPDFSWIYQMALWFICTHA